MSSRPAGAARGGPSPFAQAKRLLGDDLFRTGVLALALLVLVVFLIYPMLTTIALSFIKKGQDVTLANFTLENFKRFATAKLFRGAIVNSLVLSLLTVLVSTVIGLLYAFFLARVKLRVPRTLFLTLGTIPLVMPPFVGAYSWVNLLGRNGIITNFVESMTALQLPSIYGMGGMVLAMSVTGWPYVFLLAYGALSLGDPSLEESAQVMGAGPFRRLMSVTFPLVIPATLTGAILVFMLTIGDFGTPAILGGNQYVIPTLIYFRITGSLDFNSASAMALVSVAISLLCLAILRFYIQRRDYTTVTSRARSVPRSDNRLLGWIGTLFVVGVVVVSLLPHMVLLMGSFGERWVGTPLPTEWGLGNYVRIFKRNAGAILNSLILTSVATLIATVFGTLLAYISVRSKGRGRAIVDLTVMIPFVLPGIVVGVAIAAAFSKGPIVLVGTGAILVVAYFVRRMPYNFRAVSSSLQQLDKSMEEASTVAGASWAYTSRRITLPLIMPSVISGAILTFITLIGELSSTMILVSARWKTITVAIYEYVISFQIGPAFALGTLLAAMVFVAIFAVNRLLGVSMAALFSSD